MCLTADLYLGNAKDGLGRTPLRLAAEAAVAKAKKAEKAAREVESLG